MSTLSGKNRVSFSDLQTVPPPDRTRSYVPVLHSQLAEMVKNIGSEILHGFTFHKEQYVLARDGNQMFGMHSYKNSSDEMGLSVGFRNSYDRSLSIGILLGSNVFICDNLVFSGEVMSFRKHTANVFMDLRKMILDVVFSQKENYNKLTLDAQHMQSLDVTDDTAFRLMGLLYGRGILTPRQLPVVKREWIEPSHETFEDRNLWSFYNACTEALKSTPPAVIMEKHTQLHNVFFSGGAA